MSTAVRRVPQTKPDRIDPITTSVIQGALENIAVEMGYKLMRMSYSSIIRESEDFGAALVDAEGRGLAESAQSTPLQSGPIPGYVRGVHKLIGQILAICSSKMAGSKYCLIRWISRSRFVSTTKASRLVFTPV